MFGIEHYGVVPDLMVMGKGISAATRRWPRSPCATTSAQAFVDARASPSSTSSRTAAARSPRPPASRSSTSCRRERLAEHAEELAPVLDSTLAGPARVPDRRRRADDRLHGRDRVRGRPRDARRRIPPASKVAVKVREAGLRNGIVTYPGTGMADGKSGDIISLYPPLTFTRGRHRRHGRAAPARPSRTSRARRPRPIGLTMRGPNPSRHARSSSMDHSVITLHEGGRPEGADSVSCRCTTSSSIDDCAAPGAWRCCRVPSAGVDAVFTDRLDLGRTWQARLRGMGNTDDDAVAGARGRHRLPAGSAGWTARSAIASGRRASTSRRAGETSTRRSTPRARTAASPTPRTSGRCSSAARRRRSRSNGVAAPGAPFDDDVWLPKLGRSVSSAHSAFGETRMTPAR